MFGPLCLQLLLVTRPHFLLAAPVFVVVSGRTVCQPCSQTQERRTVIPPKLRNRVLPVRCLRCVRGRRWSTVGVVDLLKATRWLLVERRQRT
uniref:Putative secreted protein n=1 Tax=Ixodes scapularis TaxID=6945 RepID=A0A4D5RW33_IXOSC